MIVGLALVTTFGAFGLGWALGLRLAGKLPSEEVTRVKAVALLALHDAILDRQHEAAKIYADIVARL